MHIVITVIASLIALRHCRIAINRPVAVSRLIQENERPEVEVCFIRPFAGIAYPPFTSRPISPTKTEVTRGMKSSMKYPINIMLLFMNMDKLPGKDIETSLQKLKEVPEQQLLR